MEENKKLEIEGTYVQSEKEEQSSFDFAAIYTTVILNWKWFVLSLLICLGLAAVYLRYTTPIYQSYAKLLIKDNEGQNNSRNSMLNSNTLGMITNSNGIDNEMEILSSRSIAEQTVRDLKLYVNYYQKGKIKYHLLYKSNPINVDVDAPHLEKLNTSIILEILKDNGIYHVTGTYYAPVGNSETYSLFSIDKTFTKLPTTIGTRAGILTITANTKTPMADGTHIKVVINSPKNESYKYCGALSVNQTSKNTTIAQLTLRDENSQRAVDYLRQLV